MVSSTETNFGPRLQSRYQSGKSDLSEDRKQSPTNSLLQIAESLSALTNRQEIARPRGSFASLQSYPKRHHGLDYTFSNHSLNEPYGWRPVHERYAMPSHGGSACSMVSTRSLQFIKWPCDVQVEERLPSMRPKPRPSPPLHPKSAILPPTDVLKRVDMRAVEVTATNYISFTELVQALSTELTDDVQVMRALFSWIVTNDLRFKDFDPAAPSDSLVGMLRRIRNGQLSCNELLHKLCRFAGLHSCIIFGYSKDTGYRPGMPVKSNRLFCSSWLAVHVGGGWRFVNVDLAMRASRQNESINPTGDLADLNSSNGKPTIKGVAQRFCDEFYFLTDPEQHIFEHFPEHKLWQLLAKPIGMDRFVRLPLLKSAFFNANLSLKKNYGDCLVTSNGQVTLKLLMPQFVGISCSLENSADHSILRGLCLVEVLAETDEVRIQVAPSQPGKYYLHCFVAPDWRQEHDRELACAFQIHCSEHNYSRLIVMGRLPEVGFLGPTPAARTLGVVMHTTNRNGRSFLVHTSADSLRIPFVIAPGLKICHQLKSFDRPGNQMVDCDSYALLQMRPRKLTNSLRSTHNGPNAYYHVRMPVEGFYYLTVYATPNTDVEADHLECVYRVLIDVRKTPAPSTVAAFPRQTFWWVQCRLHEPLSQRLRVNQMYTFRLDAPVCDSVAVVINETDWHFLTNTNNQLGTWMGKINVGEFLGQLSVFGRFWKTVDEFHPSADLSDEESEAYVKLLDYVVVE
ncbi:hypothetical protein PHET_07424 [Paragonimus heterotremus]|uniref:KY-like immunoglobulin-like domain-containing protein n=1 Tax=Paragonimus heterotremus TaxID=100268 RepID=A0A8J4WFT2_9TREM|nr:hypothetical protein PHET_07424 [Paragonimus heterotremus]